MSRTLLQHSLEALSAEHHFGDYDALCAALREALAAPEPEPVALESVHLTRDTRGMCVVRVNGRVAIRDNGDIIDHMATLEWFAAPPAAPAPAAPVPDGWVMVPREPTIAMCIAGDGARHNVDDATRTPAVYRAMIAAAPPAAPADDHATPSGGQEAGPQDDRIEAAYWRFDARHKGYSQWKTAPMSERDAFKAEMRNALEAEKVRAEMRLAASGWRRPDAPAAPAVPLTDEQLAKIAVEDEFLLYCDQDSFNEIARAIEFAHGITGGKP